MKNALIGYTGFVGTNLMKQFKFDFLFNRKNINKIIDNYYNMIVCCAPNAEKWLANQEPARDLNNIKKLIKYLSEVSCKKFILISTVDVFNKPINVYENTNIVENKLKPYGVNRRLLEKFVEQNFNNHLIVRLPGLIGNGLKKNTIFDLHNKNEVIKIDSRSIYQFYPINILWKNIILACKLKIKLIHLNSEPISIHEISKKCFNINFTNKLNKPIPNYNMKSLYSKNLFKSFNFYHLNKKQIILSIKDYIKSEPKKK